MTAIVAKKQIELPREAPVETVENAWSLRDIGLAHIRALAGDIWTDHNIHDPGITMLDVLCFAITDLAYRTNYPIADLLAEPYTAGVAPVKQFFTAREVLGCAPVTDMDYRKLLVDCTGVKNAWISSALSTRESIANGLKGQETPIYLDRKNIALSHTMPAYVLPEKYADNTIILRGLNNIYLELDRDMERGDLNENLFTEAVTLQTGINPDDIETLVLDIRFGGLFDPATLPAATNTDFKLDPNNSADLQYLIYQADWSPKHADWAWMDATSVTVGNIHKPLAWLKKDMLLPLRLKLVRGGADEFYGVVLHISDQSYKNLQASYLRNALIQYMTDHPEWLARILGEQQNKVIRRFEVVTNVLLRLHDNRPLAEDYLSVNGTKIEEIAICADIELENDADTQNVYGEIVFQLEQFLAPNILFHSLEELLEAGRDPVDIFNGPMLDHGFIDNQELEANRKPTAIYVSDLIDILMDIKGVKAVRDVKLANYIDNANIAEDCCWMLELTGDPRNVPCLSLSKSRFSFFKGFLPGAIDRLNPGAWYEELQARMQRNKLAAAEYDLPIPLGNDRKISVYTSIQNHFPLTYGIGKAGLPDSATDERRAKARQLKAYLLFFDQMLANYLAQLSEVKNLLSVNGNPVQSYFISPVYDAPNVAPLLMDFVKAQGGKLDMNDAQAVKTAWHAYLAAEPTGYRQHVQAITDGEETRDARLNVMLDHLLARFAEQFTDYALLLNDIEGRKRADKDLVEDKRAFLREYPAISAERGLGFDYFDKTRIWQADNVTGLGRRARRLVGIAPQPDQTIAPTPKAEIIIEKDGGNKWSFHFDVPGAGFGVTSVEPFDDETEARNMFYLLLELLAGNHHSRFEKQPDNSYKIMIRTEANVKLAVSIQSFEDKESATEALHALYDYLEAEYLLEGMHIVEHILLRPRNEKFDFLPITLNEECNTPPELADPYSFRVSVILPALPARFRNIDLRHYVENILHTEAPAHVTLKICWVSHAQLVAFEAVYKPWLKAMAGLHPDMNELKKRQNDLIAVLSSLRSIYPEAVLYDCRSATEETNPIILGQTNLGSFSESASGGEE